MREAKAALERELAALQEALAQTVVEWQAKLGAAEADKVACLERQRVHLAGTQEERDALLKEQAKDERIEQMRRGAGRRLLFADLADGWSAWVELWEAKRHAMRRLREVGDRRRSEHSSQCTRCLRCLRCIRRIAATAAHQCAADIAARRVCGRGCEQVGGRLRAPEMAFAFSVWGELIEAKREAARYAQLSELRTRMHPRLAPHA